MHLELDPAEHQKIVWATEGDIKDDMFPIVTPEAKAVMLQAFELRGKDEEKIGAFAGSASKAGVEDEGEEGDDAEGDEEKGDQEN